MERGHVNSKGRVEIPSSIRLKFGTYGPNGFQQWKFADIIKTCVEKNIVDVSGYSNFDVKYCRSFAYTDNFLNQIKDKEIEFTTAEISEKTYMSLNKSYKMPTNPILLKHYETISKLTLDISEIKLLLNKYSNMQFARILRDISNILFKDRIMVIKDDRTGRIFTTFNMMKKELRDVCYYNGEKLLSIDLKTAQPYILASLLLKENPSNKAVSDFYNLTTNSDIYDYFRNKLSKPYSRDEIKILLLSFINKDGRGYNEMQEFFKNNFIEVYNIIKLKKRSEPLWLSLQKIEADIFIPVCNKYVSKGCLSVHDSLYFPESLKDRVLDSLEARFKELGLANQSIKFKQ